MMTPLACRDAPVPAAAPARSSHHVYDPSTGNTILIIPRIGTRFELRSIGNVILYYPPFKLGFV